MRVLLDQNLSPKLKPFHSLLDVGSVVEKVLIEQGIILHPGRKMSKYVVSKD